MLVTGASRGIGAEIALQYALAGANVMLVAGSRTQAQLDATRNVVLREHPTAQVLVFPADVRDVGKSARGGRDDCSTLCTFGHPRCECWYYPPRG